LDGDALYKCISLPPVGELKSKVENISFPSVVRKGGTGPTGFALIQSPPKKKLFEDDKAIREG